METLWHSCLWKQWMQRKGSRSWKPETRKLWNLGKAGRGYRATQRSNIFLWNTGTRRFHLTRRFPFRAFQCCAYVCTVEPQSNIHRRAARGSRHAQLARRGSVLCVWLPRSTTIHIMLPVQWPQYRQHTQSPDFKLKHSLYIYKYLVQNKPSCLEVVQIKPPLTLKQK